LAMESPPFAGRECRYSADTVEKLSRQARFSFLEGDRSRGFRVIGSMIAANYG